MCTNCSSIARELAHRPRGGGGARAPASESDVAAASRASSRRGRWFASTMSASRVVSAAQHSEMMSGSLMAAALAYAKRIEKYASTNPTKVAAIEKEAAECRRQGDAILKSMQAPAPE